MANTQSSDRVHVGDRVARAESINSRGTIVEFIWTPTFGQEVRVSWDSGMTECVPAGEVWPLPK